jgi:hypothetical protein
MKSKISQLGGGRAIDPRALLLEIAERDDLESITVVVKHKDGDKSAYSSSNDRWFIFACSGILADFALHDDESAF